MRLGVVGVHRQDAPVLVAEDELDQPVLERLEPARRPEHVAELAVLAGRERGQDRPLRDQLRLDVLDPREDLEGGRKLVAPHQLERRAQLVEDELEPELAGLVLDDEEHLVVVRRTGERRLRREQLVELQVAAVRHPILEVGDHAVVEGHAGGSTTVLPSADAPRGSPGSRLLCLRLGSGAVARHRRPGRRLRNGALGGQLWRDGRPQHGDAQFGGGALHRRRSAGRQPPDRRLAAGPLGERRRQRAW